MDTKIYEHIDAVPMLVNNLHGGLINECTSFGDVGDMWTGIRGVIPEYADFLYIDYDVANERGWSIIKPTGMVTAFSAPGRHVRTNMFKVLEVAFHREYMFKHISYFESNLTAIFAYKWMLYFGKGQDLMSDQVQMLKNVIIRDNNVHVARCWINNIGFDPVLQEIINVR